MIAAQLSGEITLYTAFSMHEDAIADAERERSAAPAFADDHDDDRDPSRAISRRFRAMASAWPRSSASMPGYAPGVSRNVMTGRPNLAASLHRAQRLAVALGLRHAEIADAASASYRGPSAGRRS